ncbi:MAG: hypothetical protein ACFFCW_23850 [Candidatus Hodarchaeota archaeon]
MNKHLNLFYTYNTHHLEDNVTRAFIVTLKNLTPVNLRLFIRDIIIEKLEKVNSKLRSKIGLLADPKFAFDIQLTEPPGGEKLHEGNGLIVGINYSGKQLLVFDRDSESVTGARPDAFLSDNENELSIVFEAKLWDSLYEQQIQRHYQRFFETEKTHLNRVFVEITWSEISRFLEGVAKQTQSLKEKFLIHQFLEYIDFLNLVEFSGFRNVDFNEYNYAKLNKFLSFLVKRLPPDLELDEYKYNQMLFFENVGPDNLWIDFGEGCLTCGIVCGSGKMWRAERLRDYLLESKDTFRGILDDLRSNTDSTLDLYLRIHSYFRLSRFRTDWLGNVRGHNLYPDDFDKFCATFTDPEVNSFKQMTKDRINEVFKEEIKKSSAELDSRGLFPKWEDSDSFLQYCYFQIDFAIPDDILVSKGLGDLVEFFGKVFGAMRNTMSKFNSV